MSERIRWKFWGLLTRSRRVCPANAVGAVVWRVQPVRGIFVDDTCRRDCAATGSCWCGNLRRDEAFPIADEDVTFPVDSSPSAPLDDWNW
jgi:hypothetical protein